MTITIDAMPDHSTEAIERTLAAQLMGAVHTADRMMTERVHELRDQLIEWRERSGKDIPQDEVVDRSRSILREWLRNVRTDNEVSPLVLAALTEMVDCVAVELVYGDHGADVEECSACEGEGYVTKWREGGRDEVEEECGRCNGTGLVDL